MFLLHFVSCSVLEMLLGMGIGQGIKMVYGCKQIDLDNGLTEFVWFRKWIIWSWIGYLVLYGFGLDIWFLKCGY